MAPSFLAGPAEADVLGSLTKLTSSLPSGRHDHAAAAIGQYVYYFGGGAFGSDHHALDGIVRLDTVTGTVTTVGTLPTARSYASAISTGSVAYVFGGCNDGSQCRSSPLADIVKFDPSNNSAWVVASFSSGRVATSAVWTGAYAYIFGGDSCGPHLQCPVDQIVRFDPATNSVTTMNATITRIAASAVWDGTSAYIFGGIGSSGVTDDIVRYTPATDNLTTLSASLPQGRYWTSAGMIGSRAYIFGGYDTTFNGTVLAFTPLTSTVEETSFEFTTDRYATAAAVSGASAYVSGGWDGTTRLAEIWKFTPV